MTTRVLLPWNLGSYQAMNGFHPLLRDWLALQANVDLIRPDWGHELAAPIGLEADEAALEHGLGPIFARPEARRFFSVVEFEWLARLSTQVEFHHTVPFTSATRPFVFHCEAMAPIFMPFVLQGTADLHPEFAHLLAIYRRLFESEHCLAI